MFYEERNGDVSSPLYIPVTAETHARFCARQDEHHLGADAYVRRLLDDSERLERIGAVATAAADGMIAAANVRELATGTPSVCGWCSPSGRYCEKAPGHSGNHRCVAFSLEDAERAAAAVALAVSA